MDWVNIITVVLIIVVLGGISYFYPAARVLLIKNIFSLLRKNQSYLTYATYNALPKGIRDKISSDVFAEVVSTVLSYGITAVEEDIIKKKK